MTPAQLLSRLFQTRHAVTPRSMLIMAAIGMAVGLAVGYVVMGTMHAVLEMGVETHYQDGAPPRGGQNARVLLPDAAAAAPRGGAFAAREVTATRDAAARGGARPADPDAPWTKRGGGVHTLCTSNGSPYQNFQNRIMYGSYKLVQGMSGGENLVAFTRILHRTVEDDMMDEIPTFRAIPLTPKCDAWCEFPVSDRPNAVRQFFTAARADPAMIKAPWVLLIETDYVWMEPLRGVPLAESSQPGWAFLFDYIQPKYPNIEKVMRTLFPKERGDLSLVPQTGPAPVMMRVADWERVVPEWERLTADIEASPEAKEKLGWVREMYAFSVAVALQEVPLTVHRPPQSKLIVQPPADHRMGAAAMTHYTWGAIYKDAGGREVWKFDKRFYTDRKFALQVPQLEEPPQDITGLKLQDGKLVTPELNALMTAMIRRMNAASKDLPVIAEAAA